MTEAEWLACDDPAPMLTQIRDSASERKLRLFAVAVSRLYLSRYDEPALRSAVEAAERAADGEATDAELVVAGARIGDRIRAIHLESGATEVTDWFEAADPELRSVYLWCALTAVRATTGMIWLRDPDLTAYRIAGEHFAPVQPPLLRDISGNPFRSVAFSPGWRNGTATAIAHQMYEARDFSPLPILADALQDAGCEDEAVLNHCRSDGPHVRGCWVVDLVLGKS